MTPKEKAQDLVNKYLDNAQIYPSAAKQCALIAVEEIIKEVNSIITLYPGDCRLGYWQQVKHEIEKL